MKITNLGMLALIALIIFLSFSESAKAQLIKGCATQVSEAEIRLPGSIVIQGDAPVGSAVTGWHEFVNDRVYMCNGKSSVTSYATGTAGSVGTYVESGLAHSIYPTGVPGLGVVIQGADPNRPIQAIRDSVRIELYQGSPQPLGIVGKAKFIRTGNINSGSYTIVRRRVANLSVRWTYLVFTGEEFSSLWLGSTNIQVISKTCDLAAGDVNRTITLDNKKLTDFDGVDYVGQKAFELTANCSNASNVTFSFSGVAASGSGQLFNNTGSAGGVGLWLYSNIGGARRTIPASGGSPADRQRTVNVSSNRAVLPLGAAYHKTTGSVSKGTLKSTATVTITYN